MYNHIITFLFFTIHALIQPQSTGFDFRSTKWGMTMEEVEQSEGLTPIFKGYDRSFEEMIQIYEIYIDSRKVDLYYHFDGGKLSGADYMIHWGSWQRNQNEHTISDRLHSIYKIFVALETKKYKPLGKWYFTHAGFSKEYEEFTNCQQYNGDFTNSNDNISTLEECLTEAINNNKIISKGIVGITYKNQRTRVSIEFPTKSYSMETYHEMIGWIRFRSWNVDLVF